MVFMTLDAVFRSQQQAFHKSPFPPAPERRANLRRLRKALIARQDDFAQAIHEDFGGRSRFEVLFSEILVSAGSLKHAEANVDDWMVERPASLGWALQPARAFVLPQPLGVVGIMGSWNYPVFVCISPLAGALAAGNRVVIKPSETTPRTSGLLAKLIGETFAPDHVAVVEGGVELGREFAATPWDRLIFTGSAKIGREVMRAAAANLTPLTLELGGKCPALVAEDADLVRAAADIVYGKFLNAGQTCVAPDYVLVPASLLDRFATLLRAAIEAQFPNALSNPNYTSMVREQDAERLSEWGERQGKRVAPTVVVDPPADSPLLRDEIFGPVLPVVPYSELDAAIAYVNARPRPLTLYLFTSSQRIVDSVQRETVSGGLCVNDTLVHIAAEDLPFGGVGASGFGAYHGKAGFDACSHLKAVFQRQGTAIGRLIRPPYGKLQEWLRGLMLR